MRIIKKVLLIIILSICSISIMLPISNADYYYPDRSTYEEGKIIKNSENEDEDDWVGDAFRAASDFISEKVTDDKNGWSSKALDIATSLTRAINMILLVLLAGLSIISLTVVGLRYLASGASPGQRQIAQQSLHTVFIGMAIGFGAFVIWQIAMSIVKIIIESLAT